AGWALQEERSYDNQNYQDELDAETLYSLLENEITQLFYERDENGVPAGWVKYIKNSIARVAPNFTMKRMLNDYEDRFYSKLHARSRKMKINDYARVRDLAAWKRMILKLWEKIKVIEYKHPDISKDSVNLGDSYQSELILELGELSSSDIGVDLVIPNYPSENGTSTFTREFELVNQENGHATYRVEVTPDMSGVFEYGIRIYPKHEDLPHRQDFALVKWA
ncbi:MAG: alpha-glucan family phosphorylase, partial [Bacteroidales bacterium]|nr:alpha-glucan family phosphorylase [Bacteroidales bacterium]